MSADRDYLIHLLAELKSKVHDLEQQKVRMITAPVTAIDAGSGTFSVLMPVQQDGTTATVAGISAPATFLPAIGDTVSIQVIGAVPQYQPGTLAPDIITDREIAPGVKVHVFRQETAPVAVDIGDVWIDTDNGNAENIWGPVGTIVRQNLCLNPSFEADPVGVTSSITSWVNYNNGSPGSLTVSVVNAGSGIAIGTKAGSVVSSSMPATLNTAMGFQQSFLAGPGDVMNIQAVLTLAVTDVNKVPELVVEWLNASFTVLGSSVVAGSGTSTSQQTLTHNGSALPAGTSFVRLTLRRRSNGSGGSLTNADLIVDAVCVEKNRSSQAQTGYFDGDNPNTAESKWDTPAAAPGFSTSTFWQNGTPGANQWYPVLLRTAAIQPGSLVANNVVAGGTVTASLLEALMVLTNIVIAGDPAGEQSRMDATGLRAYAVDAGDGLLSEVAYFGRGLNVRNPDSGVIVGSITQDGAVTGSDLTIDNDPIFAGTALSTSLAAGAQGFVADATYAASPGTSATTSTELVHMEIAFNAEPGRAYAFHSEPIEIITSASTDGHAVLRVRYTTDGSTPTTASTQLKESAYGYVRSAYPGRHSLHFRFDGPAPGGVETTYRLALCYAAASGTTGICILTTDALSLWIEDVGLQRDNVGVPVGGGTNAVTTTTVEYAATWTRSWAQDHTTISFDDPMWQGYGDSLYGSQVASAGFPSVTTLLTGATIKHIWVYMFAEYWGQYSGGTLNMGYHGTLSEPATYPGSTSPHTNRFFSAGTGFWIEVTNYSGWSAALTSGAFRGISISAPDTRIGWYGRFSGASQARPRLRIQYTK